MSTISGNPYEFSGRFLASDATGVDFLVMPGATRVRIPILEELLHEWEKATPGQTITVRVSSNFASRSGLLSGGSVGTKIGGIIAG